jgi:hypothetical protein
MVAWALAYATKPIKGIVAAADKDQAALVRAAIATLCRLNSCLESLDVQSWAVVNRNTGSSLDILSSDVPGSFGYLPDFVCCEEISHWPEGRGEQLWASLFSAAAKRRNCLLVCILNAGFQESWCWKVREMVRTDPNWYFSHLEGPQASWITADRLDEQQRILPPLVFDRLWMNVWSSGSGDALPTTDIDAAVTLPGPLLASEDGWTYFGGLDLSVSRDHSALAVIGRDWTGRLKLVALRAWVPPRAGKIDLASVGAAVLDVHRIFRPIILADPYQCEMLGQQVRKAGVMLGMQPFTGQALSEMASGLIEVFASRTIDIFPDAQLLADLRRLRLKESPSGWKLDAPRTTAGHCDRATALALAVLAARKCPNHENYTGPIVLNERALKAWPEKPDNTPWYLAKPDEDPAKEKPRWQQICADLGIGLDVDDEWPTNPWQPANPWR